MGHDGLVFVGRSLLATNCSKTAALAVDFPHGKGSSIRAIALSQARSAGNKLNVG